MTAYTPIYNLPYVEASDLVASYPTVSEELAENIESALSGITLANDGATITTQQTTTSTTYTDLATVGPSVTVTTGTKALVIVNALMNVNGTGQVYASWAVSGATTLAASDEWAVQMYHLNNIDPIMGAGYGYLVEGLTAGSNTFTMKYRVSGNTGDYRNRHIAVLDMGS